MMKRYFRHPFYFLILFGLFISVIVKADSWDNPGVKIYYSDNMKFKLVVSPKRTSNKYYMWNYYKGGNHTFSKKMLRKKEKFMLNITDQDTILIPCTAELYQIGETDSVLLWKSILLNEVCPVNAIVANDGSSIATFDNWYSKGYGLNVFVVYDEKGNTKKTFNLEEISPFPIDDYPMSISSIYWNKGVKYIDVERIEIIFEAKDNSVKTRVYNLKKNEFEE